MTFTILGWLFGWLLIGFAGIQFSYSRLDIASSWLSLIAWAVLAMLVLASANVRLGDSLSVLQALPKSVRIDLGSDLRRL